MSMAEMLRSSPKKSYVASSLTAMDVQVAYTLLSGSFLRGAQHTLMNATTIPLVFGMFAFCFAGHGVLHVCRCSVLIRCLQLPRQDNCRP